MAERNWEARGPYNLSTYQTAVPPQDARRPRILRLQAGRGEHRLSLLRAG